MPPHPDMPDEEPSVFMEMEKKLSSLLGIPAPLITKEQPDNSGEKNSFHIEQSSVDPGRFMQVRDQSLVESKSENSLRYDFNAHKGWVHVPFVSAWASSVYTWRWWWWWHTYHAEHVNKKLCLFLCFYY